MRPTTAVWLAVVLLTPSVLYAGQIYGTIVTGGQGVKGLNIEIQCGSDAPTKGTTAADGSYRINVQQQGQCTMALPDQPGKPSAMVFSSSNPALYNFELAKKQDGTFELRRRQ
jgi:hypothetical protein